MKPAAGFILKELGNNKESFARSVAVKNIVGYKENGNGSAQNADFVRLCAVEP